MPRCYSYCRWSSGKQTTGTSLERQMQMAEEWVEAQKDKGFYLDKNPIIDAGKSGHFGDNLDPEQGNLAKFIEKTKAGEIEHNSYLIIERLDRFSRADPVAIEGLINELVRKHGINIAILSPVQTIITKDNLGEINIRLMVVLELQMANAASKEKSFRLKKAWESKRKRIRAGEIQVQLLPNWLSVDENTSKLKIDKEKAKAIHYLFQRTIEGIGQVALCREMTEKFPPISSPTVRHKTPHWNKSYISKLLRDRRLLGEYQPHKFESIENRDNIILTKKKKRAEGAAVPDYYPRVISDEVFYKAQSEKHKRLRAKTDKHMKLLNLFRGLVFCKYSGNTMHLQTATATRPNGDKYIQKRYADYGYLRGDKSCCPWQPDYYRFEAIVLDALSELDENTFKKSIKGVVAEKRSLTDESIQLMNQIDKLSHQLSDSRFFSITDTIVNGLSRLQDRKTDIDARLKKLDEMSDSVEKVGIEGLRNVSELFGEAGQHNEERRKQIRDVIPHIIRRIEVLPLKAENRTVKAIIMIDLVDGTRRLCWMAKTKLKVNQILLLSVKNRKPIMKLSKSGMVLFSRKDQPAKWDEVLLIVDKKPLKDKEARLRLIKMMFEMRAELPKYLSSKQLTKWAKIDLETIFSYDWHGQDKKTDPAKEQEHDG